MTFGLSRAGTHHRNFILLCDRSRRKRAGARDFAEKGQNVIFGNEFRYGGGGVLWFALVVESFHIDLFSFDSACRVDFFLRQLNALVGAEAERRLATGHGAVLAHKNDFGVSGTFRRTFGATCKGQR